MDELRKRNKKKRDQGISDAELHAHKQWLVFAYLSLEDVTRRQKRLTADDLTEDMVRVAKRLRIDLPQTHDLRALGAVILKGVKNGLIRRVGTAESRKTTRHLGLVSVWESLVYTNGKARNDEPELPFEQP